MEKKEKALLVYSIMEDAENDGVRLDYETVKYTIDELEKYKEDDSSKRMTLEDYIHNGYTIVTSRNVASIIRHNYPKAIVFDNGCLDGIPAGKLLVDWYFENQCGVIAAKPKQQIYVVANFNREFMGSLWVN